MLGMDGLELAPEQADLLRASRHTRRRSPQNRQIPLCFCGDVSQGLNSGDVAGEAAHDNPALAALNHLYQLTGYRTLRGRFSGAQRVGGITDDCINALPAQRLKAPC